MSMSDWEADSQIGYRNPGNAEKTQYQRYSEVAYTLYNRKQFVGRFLTNLLIAASWPVITLAWPYIAGPNPAYLVMVILVSFLITLPCFLALLCAGHDKDDAEPDPSGRAQFPMLTRCCAGIMWTAICTILIAGSWKVATEQGLEIVDSRNFYIFVIFIAMIISQYMARRYIPKPDHY